MSASACALALAFATGSVLRIAMGAYRVLLVGFSLVFVFGHHAAGAGGHQKIKVHALVGLEH